MGRLSGPLSGISEFLRRLPAWRCPSIPRSRPRRALAMSSPGGRRRRQMLVPIVGMSLRVWGKARRIPRRAPVGCFYFPLRQSLPRGAPAPSPAVHNPRENDRVCALLFIHLLSCEVVCVYYCLFIHVCVFRLLLFSLKIHLLSIIKVKTIFFAL
jgi:hypothetical protein